MKVAIIVRRLNVKGGTQRQALELGLALTQQKHSVKFYTFKYDPSNCYEEFKNISVTSLDDESNPKASFLSKVSYLSFFISLYRENRNAKKLAMQIDDDTEILNPHDQLSYRVAYFFKKIKNSKTPSVWMMNDLPTKYFSYLREKENNPSYEINFVKRIFNYLVDTYDIKKYISSQDVIAVLDNRDRDWVSKFFDKEAVVVRSGLDLDKFNFKKREKINTEVKILAVGILLPHRRFEDVIEAVSLLRKEGIEARLEIIGDTDSNPSYHRKLLNLVSELKLESQVLFLNKVSDTDLSHKYSESDVLVFPCHLQSWGLAVFEAMASGLPVVVSKTSGASEVLEDRNNALLIDPKSPEAIYGAIKSLIEDNELYFSLSLNGRNFVENNISWENYAKNMINIFEKLK